MPQFNSPEDVIESFRKACEANDSMRPNINQIQTAVEKLEQIANEPDDIHAAAMCYDLVTQIDQPEVGAAAANLLYFRENGHDLACNTGQEIMLAQFENKKVNPNDFLRSRHGMNGFTNAVIENTSPRYESDTQALIQEMATRAQVLAYKPRADTSAAGLTPEEREVAVELGNECLDLMVGAGLTEPTLQYLNQVSSVALSQQAAKAIGEYSNASGDALHAQQEKLAKAISNNSTTLRAIGPRLATERHRNPELQGNAIWKAAVASAQKTFNLPHTENVAEVEATVGIQSRVHTAENRQKVDAFHARMATAPPADSLNANLSQVAAELKAAGVWELDGAKLKELDIGLKKPANKTSPEVPLPASQISESQPGSPRTQSIRDALRSAKDHLKSALHLDDEHKKNRAEKQLAKREEHLGNLLDRRAALQQQLDDPAVQDALKTKADPKAFISGHQQARAGQQDLMDARDLLRQAAKLDQRIERNEQKIANKQQEIDRLQTKIDLRQNLQQSRTAPSIRSNRLG
ncbi:MAG: hypothetical protein KDK99_19995 [Verrucomicrobiales bacterium]|nr:hypothetical protein [Verrucomicrobiales bacterium]